MHMLSPSDIVGPSPVTSNGTETTEIEDDVADDIEQDHGAGGNSYRHSDVSNKNSAVHYTLQDAYRAALTWFVESLAYHKPPRNRSPGQP